MTRARLVLAALLALAGACREPAFAQWEGGAWEGPPQGITSGVTTIDGGTDNAFCFNAANDTLDCQASKLRYVGGGMILEWQGGGNSIFNFYRTISGGDYDGLAIRHLAGSSGTISFNAYTGGTGADDIGFDFVPAGTGRTKFTGASLHTGRATFGSEVDAADAVDVGETAGCFTFEGATADAHETRLCVVDPTVGDGLVNIPNVGAAATRTVGLLEAAQTWTAIQTYSSTSRGPAGSAAAPTWAFAGGANDVNDGMYNNNGGPTIAVDGAEKFHWATGEVRVVSSSALGFASGAPATTALDSRIARVSAGVFKFGNASAYDNTAALGDASNRLASINSTVYNSGAAGGASGTFTIRDGGGLGDCTIVVAGGIVDDITC